MKPKIYKRNDHIVSRKNIDTDALKIMHRLIKNGYKGYLVGGGVRDLLLNRKPKDFDIATDATPRQVKSLFRNCRIIGRRFKLAHIFFKDNKIIEVSTFRDTAEVNEENVQTLAKDNFYGTEVTDAARRDITINGLYYDLSTFSIIDYVGGFKDLQKKIIRIIGCPTIRIIEDPVRMWRAIRHSAKCGFKIESESKKAIIENKNLISEIPTMRIHDELKKDFCSGYSYPIFSLAAKLKILELIFPELSKPATSLNNEDNETSQALKFVDNWITKGYEISITAVLSVFTISIKKAIEKNKHYNELFENEEQIDEFVNSLYTKFFVPKKEKEVIITAIKLWKKILNKDPKELNLKSLSRRIALVELKYLIWFTNNNTTLIDMIDEAQKLKSDFQEKKFRNIKTPNFDDNFDKIDNLNKKKREKKSKKFLNFKKSIGNRPNRKEIKDIEKEAVINNNISEDKEF